MYFPRVSPIPSDDRKALSLRLFFFDELLRCFRLCRRKPIRIQVSSRLEPHLQFIVLDAEAFLFSEEFAGSARHQGWVGPDMEAMPDQSFEPILFRGTVAVQ